MVRANKIELQIREWEKSKQIKTYLEEINEFSSKLSPQQKRLLRWAPNLARHYDPIDPYKINSLKPK